MFKKKEQFNTEIDIEKLKNLKLFEKIEVEGLDCNGLSIYYIRVPDGLIRCASHQNAINQVFIPISAIYFSR